MSKKEEPKKKERKKEEPKKKNKVFDDDLFDLNEEKTELLIKQLKQRSIVKEQLKRYV